ncbi:hypothetical protein NIES39_J03850 [Arthrospira platensis NIES-39]|nr:hypothetical protein NIES39_J03850 [Arthrospira platensis NIES-39]
MYHNPYNLVNFLRGIFNKNVLILNNLLKIKSLWLYELAKLIKISQRSRVVE